MKTTTFEKWNTSNRFLKTMDDLASEHNQAVDEIERLVGKLGKIRSRAELDVNWSSTEGACVFLRVYGDEAFSYAVSVEDLARDIIASLNDGSRELAPSMMTAREIWSRIKSRIVTEDGVLGGVSVDDVDDMDAVLYPEIFEKYDPGYKLHCIDEGDRKPGTIEQAPQVPVAFELKCPRCGSMDIWKNYYESNPNDPISNFCHVCGHIFPLEDDPASNVPVSSTAEETSGSSATALNSGAEKVGTSECRWCKRAGCTRSGLYCPKCKITTHSSQWVAGHDLHRTDEFGTKICPRCGKSIAEDEILVRCDCEIDNSTAPDKPWSEDRFVSPRSRKKVGGPEQEEKSG